MKDLYEAYKDEVVILMVYIREAHPASPDQTSEDAGWKVVDGTVFYQPATYEERRRLAETACTFWELSFQALVDTMQPSIGRMFQATPNRLYVLDAEGKIAYRGVKGARGVNVHEGELEVRKLLGITEGNPVTKPLPERAPSGGRGRSSSRRAPERQADDSGDQPETPEPAVDGSADKPKTPRMIPFSSCPVFGSRPARAAHWLMPD